MQKKLPQFMQSALWSYNLDSFNPDDPNDKKIIIENILNHGTNEQIDWLLKYYSVTDLRKALSHPSRGSWNPRSLHYWTNVLKVKTRKHTYERAINSLYLYASIH